MPGILPNASAGGVDPASPNVSNAYIPGEEFTFTGCEQTALPNDCTARIATAQINAIVSELISFAECLNPDGTWTCVSLQNLCAAFTAWKEDIGPGSMSEAIENLLQFTDCNGAPLPLNAALATCADIAGIGADRFVTGLVGYDPVTKILTLSMSTPGNVGLNLAAVISDAVASIVVNHDTSLAGDGKAINPLKLAIQHDASLAGLGSQAIPLTLAIQHDASLTGLGSVATPLLVAQATAVQIGGAQLATQPEVDAGVNATDIVTPLTLKTMAAGNVAVVTDATITGNGKTATPLSVVQATAVQRGGSALATQAEVNTGTDATKIVTAATLAGMTAGIAVAHDTSLSGTGKTATPLAVVQATTTQLGGMEIATQAEVNAGVSATVAVTPSTFAGYAGTYVNILLPLGGYVDWGAGDIRITGNLNNLVFTGASLGYTFDAPVLISTPGTDGLTVTSLDAGGAQGPTVDLFRDSSSPAVNDGIGTFDWNGRTSTGAKFLYGRLIVTLDNVTNGAGASSMFFRNTVANVLTTQLLLTGTGAQIPNLGATTPGTVRGTDVTVTNLFTSRGIDDNATGERLELSDTGIILGVLNADFTIQHIDTDRMLQMSSGDSAGAGGTLSLFGSAHATRPYQAIFGTQITVVESGIVVRPGYTSFNDGTGALLGRVGEGVSVMTYWAGNGHRWAQDTTNTPGNANNTQGMGFNGGTLSVSSAVAGAITTFNHSGGAGGTLTSYNLLGVQQGSVSGTGTTIVYGTFSGSHDAQFVDMSIFGIYEGSLLRTVKELCEWYALKYTDHDGNTAYNELSVPVDAKVGDIVDFEISYEVDKETPVTYHEDEFEKEEFDEPYDTLDIVDGRAVVVKKTRRKTRTVSDEMVAHDSAGNVIYDTVPDLDKDGHQKHDDVPALINGEQVMQDVPLFNRKGKPIVDDVLDFDGDGQPIMLDVAVMGDNGRQLFDLVAVIDVNGKPVMDIVPVHDEAGNEIYDEVIEADADGKPVVDTVPVRDELNAEIYDEVFVKNEKGKRIYDMIGEGDDAKRIARTERVLRTIEVPRKTSVRRTKEVARLAKILRFEKKQRTSRVQRTKSVPMIMAVPRTKQVEKRVRVPRWKRIEKTDIKRERITVKELVKAEVISLKNDYLVKVDVCREAMCKQVYGGFIAWDMEYMSDLRTVSLGTFKVRLKKGEVPIDGDFVVSSDIEGCGMMLDPDTPMTARIHSCIAAKLTSDKVIETYPDGSFTVPCTWHCG